MAIDDSFLKTAREEERFVLSNGRTLKNLHELRNSLLSMDEGTFRHHVNPDRNDFANWVEGVFKDKELAETLRKAKSTQEMFALLNGSRQRQTEAKPKLLPEPKKERPRKVKRQKVAPKRLPEVQKPELLTDLEEPKVPAPEKSDIEKKLDEILLYEKELQIREKKIQEIEEHIERELSGEVETHTLSKEFIQGFVAGVLVAVIAILLYVNLA